MIEERRILRCPDGAEMVADLLRPDDRPRPLTVVCHGFKGFRLWGLFPPVARRLAESGRAVALFDLSHNGTSGGEDFDRLDLFERQTPGRHVADLLTVLDALADEPWVDGAAGCGLLGHSMGGGVALLAAARRPSVSHVVTLNGVSHFRRFPAEAEATLEREGRLLIPNARTGQDMPLGRGWIDQARALDVAAACGDVAAEVLVVNGSADTVVTPDEGQALVDWLPRARRLVIEGGDHTLGARHPWQGWTPELTRALEAADAFLPAVAEGAAP